MIKGNHHCACDYLARTPYLRLANDRRQERNNLIDTYSRIATWPATNVAIVIEDGTEHLFGLPISRLKRTGDFVHYFYPSIEFALIKGRSQWR